MEPTSSPDNARPQRGLSRFWPVHREADDDAGVTDPAEHGVARPDESSTTETEMVALGSRRAADDLIMASQTSPGAGSPPPAMRKPAQNSGWVNSRTYRHCLSPRRS